MVLNKNENEIERLMREGQAAARRGDKAMSRVLLTQLLELEPQHEQAWMWLSGVVTETAEQETCLENVLIINPNNAQARKGLEFIRSKSGGVPSIAFERLSGPLSMKDLSNEEAPGASSAIIAPPQTGNLHTSQPANHAQATASAPAQQAPWQDFDTAPSSAESQNASHTGYAATTTLQVAASDFEQPQAPAYDIVFAPQMDGIMPFQAPDEADLPQYTGGPPTHEMPSDTTDTSMDVPTWARNTRTSSVTPPGGRQAATHELKDENLLPATSPNAPTPASQAAQAATQADLDLGAWLDDLAASAPFKFAEDPQTDAATTQLNTMNADQTSSHGPFPADPFTNPGALDFAPVGPYTAAQLPSPDDLPGSRDGGEPGQPWYLQASNDAIATPPDFRAEQGAGVGYPTDSGGSGASRSSKVTMAATVECPNCRQSVPETSLACPECRFSFFVHCPRCHELVDTSAAKSGLVEPCPYCAADINKMDLGLNNATGGLAYHGPVPKETEKSWMGEGLAQPTRRSGFLLTFSWLIDVMWLLIIVMMVWALTQLPTWLHLTDLYN